jgi:patatin-like phospholipase/acyl hydrolase
MSVAIGRGKSEGSVAIGRGKSEGSVAIGRGKSEGSVTIGRGKSSAVITVGQEKSKGLIKPFYILALCGGGARGLITISFLIEMEKTIKIKNPDFSIGQFFDMFAGCSIGSIMAGNFAIDKMNVNDLSKYFSGDNIKNIMNKTFKDKIFDIFQTGPKYDGISKNAIIKEIFEDAKFCETTGKHLVIPTFDLKHNKAKIFRTSKASPELLLKDVICASTAAPCYFPSYHVNNCEDNDDLNRKSKEKEKESLWLIDGGVVLNNPAMVAIAEAKRFLTLHNDPTREIICICVGTGLFKNNINPEDTKSFGGIEWLANGLIDILTNTSYVDQECKWSLNKHNYLKVDMELGEVDSKMDNTDSKQLDGLQKLGIKMWSAYDKQVMKILNLSV